MLSIVKCCYVDMNQHNTSFIYTKVYNKGNARYEILNMFDVLCPPYILISMLKSHLEINLGRFNVHVQTPCSCNGRNRNKINAILVQSIVIIH